MIHHYLPELTIVYHKLPEMSIGGCGVVRIGDMYWGYVVEICRRDMLWAYVAGIRWLHRQWVYAISQGYVVGIRCRHTLVASDTAGIRWLHRAWVYGGARNVGGCSVPGVCRWRWGGVKSIRAFL